MCGNSVQTAFQGIFRLKRHQIDTFIGASRWFWCANVSVEKHLALHYQKWYITRHKLYIVKIKCLDYRGMSDKNPHFQHFPAGNVSILNFFRPQCAFVIHVSLEFQTWLFDKVSKSNSPRCIANLNQWTKLRYIFIFTFIWWHVLLASDQCLIWVGTCRYQWIVQLW